MKRIVALLVTIGLMAGCGAAPTPAPDLVATQVAVMAAAAATLTAGAPAPSATQPPQNTPAQPPASSAVPTRVPQSTPTPLPALTSTPHPPVPAQTTPPVGPLVGSFAVVAVYADDQLNVRAGPGVERPVVGAIPYYGRQVEVHARQQQIGASWWAPVRYGQLRGWVNTNYLAPQVGNVGDPIAARAAQVILAVRDHDLQTLASLVHPVKGVTFSPYTYVRPLQGAPGEADLVFSPAQLAGLWTNPTVYHWGTYDGSGKPIDLTFQEYYAEFVYDVDFAQPDVIGFDEIIGQGNTINNIADVYPNGVPIEYHFEGFDPQYGGLDWRSLRLVWEELDGTWYLVGIVHDEWTI